MREKNHPVVTDEIVEFDLALGGLRLKVGRYAPEAEGLRALIY